MLPVSFRLSPGDRSTTTLKPKLKSAIRNWNERGSAYFRTPRFVRERLLECGSLLPLCLSKPACGFRTGIMRSALAEPGAISLIESGSKLPHSKDSSVVVVSATLQKRKRRGICFQTPRRFGAKRETSGSDRGAIGRIPCGSFPRVGSWRGPLPDTSGPVACCYPLIRWPVRPLRWSVCGRTVPG